ncbi:MAG: hypothetical protein ACRDOI_17075 [Trebonia sp.]
MSAKRMPRWPLFLIAAPAAIAVWSGWVGLGQLCGFGVIHPLPGIWDAATINTAITLPVGVEAYGAYALGAWLTPGTSGRARKFARRSAIGSLSLGMLGQVAYHLLAAVHATSAPWPVTMLVSCLPVVALALGTALAHLLREPAEDVPSAEGTGETVAAEAPTAPVSTPETVADTVPVAVLEDVPADVPVGGQGAVPPVVTGGVPVASLRAVPRRTPRRTSPGKPKSPERLFAAEIERGDLPSIREVKRRAACGTPRAQAILADLQEMMQEKAA